MIPLSQGPQPVEAAALVIILQELDAACRGSTEPRGSGVRSLGLHCPEGRGLPWAQPSPSDSPPTHAHTHLSLNSLYLFSRLPRELRLSQEPAEPPGTPKTSGAFLGMQGAHQEVLARMAAPSWALHARTRQREPAPYARTLRSQDGERCVSMRKKLPRSLVKGKPQAVRTALSTAGPHVGRLSVMQYKRADEPLLERMWIYYGGGPLRAGWHGIFILSFTCLCLFVPRVLFEN